MSAYLNYARGFLGEPNSLMWVLIQFGLLSYGVCLVLSCIGWMVGFITTSAKLGIKFKKIGVFFLILALLNVVLVVIFNVIHYQFFDPDGWKPFFDNKINLTSSIYAAGLGLIVVFISSSFWKPLLLSKDWFKWFFEVGLLISCIGIFATTFTGTNYFPIWLLVFNFFFAILLVYVGWMNIKQGHFIVDAIIQVFELQSQNVEEKFSPNWQMWINTRLPNPDDQKALRDALNKSHPPSKARTLFGIFFISVGGWLIITTLTSIVDWFVQRFLDSFFS